MSYSKDEKMESMAENTDVETEHRLVSGETHVSANITSFDTIRHSKNSTYSINSPNRYLEMPLLPTEKNSGVKHMEENKLLEMYMEKVDRDQRDLKEDIRESERRNQKRMEESDKRMDEKMGQIVDIIREQNQKMANIDLKIDSVSKEVSSGLAEYRKFMWGITISIFLAIAAMILTIIL